MPPRSTRALALAAALAAVLGAAGPARAAAPPANPYLAAGGAGAMHGDTASSDTTPRRGPGTGPAAVHRTALQAACPTVLAGSDGYPVAVCTGIFDRAPHVHLLDPATGASLAELTLAKSGVLGGIYSYLDERDRLVVADGSGDLLRVAHTRAADGGWQLKVVERTPLTGAVAAGDGVVGLAPDWRGRVWFATGRGLVGTVDTATGTVRTADLGEAVANSLSTAPEGAAVTTDHALYLLRAGADGVPRVVWRRAYDRGPARKPGQLSHGTGATATFFGPRGGSEYLAITDNAAPQENLIVVSTKDNRTVCRIPVLDPNGSGTENSPIGAGNSVYVASTYGYPYPAVPDGAGPAEPANAPFTGGLTRVDIDPDGRGCAIRWDTRIRSAAVPKLSLADGTLYTVERTGVLDPARTGILDRYDFLAVDAETGRVAGRRHLGTGFLFDTLQMAGNATPGGVWWQGTVTGVVRIAPE
ncbi:hypothetical protein ADL22_06620 [Streptomyces sp. NRRL F-4489]|uniref:hypothetical protein n=1 Tax=Streptomyces sp. NRRL F-4489 TaxID=1609095 RepID=UPI000747A538|nr:hypothetical protein [Streptomyces sp. NRRL F-4489]KUL51216.1 hypothetical protein ADL22_06620 [Streptomyces sp. NRRL F-4489]